LSALLARGRQCLYEKDLQKAAGSETYFLYRRLVQGQFQPGLLSKPPLLHSSRMTLSYVLRLRGDLLPLGMRPWMSEEVHACPLCSLSANDDLHHFLSECPGLNELREQYLNGVEWTSTDRLLDALSSPETLPILAKFALMAIKKRNP